MRYYYTEDTLYVRGGFKAVTNGAGEVSRLSTLFLHAGSAGGAALLQSRGYSADGAGFAQAAPLRNICILQYDFLSVFVSAAADKVYALIVTEEGASGSALKEACATAAAAAPCCCIAAAPLDAEVKHTTAAAGSSLGSRIAAAVAFGAAESGQARTDSGREPRYFIYSRYENNGWFEWKRNGCPYYPCHFAGQVCQFCYCPFYPCKDESLGEWVESSSLKRPIWACTNCTFLHEKKYADYLISHPDADFDEVKNA
ncbi:MAG TPA: cysteine-rich small domain-containing protein [Methanocorpusculum sp.]|nr:cysteine-rich small domain-containing protein [Methanocorpusculum sp.]